MHMLIYEVKKVLSMYTNTKHVDHQAEAYVAPRRVMAEANGNAIVETNGTAKVIPILFQNLYLIFHVFISLNFVFPLTYALLYLFW